MATIDLAKYGGLYPDGSHSDYNEMVLQHLFDTVQPCTTIFVPRGAVYAHSRELVLVTSDVAIAPEGAGRDPVLLSTDAYTRGEKCSLWRGFPGPCLVFLISGDRDNVSGLVVANRQQSFSGQERPPTEHGLVLGGDGQRLTDVVVFRPDDAGIETEGATHLTLDHPTIVSSGTGLTYAGGASITFHSGSRGPTGNVFVQDPRIINSGDDGICVESYIGGGLQHDIWVNGETYTNTRPPYGGHGIAVVGGKNILFTRFSVTGPPAAGIYVASGQRDFRDRGSSNLIFLWGTIRNANAAAPGLQNGAVLVWSDTTSEMIDHVLVEHLTIENTSAAASYQVGDFAESHEPTLCNDGSSAPRPVPCPSATNVEFKDITFRGNTSNRFHAGSTPPTHYWALNWRLRNPDGSTTALPDHAPGPAPFPN